MKRVYIQGKRVEYDFKRGDKVKHGDVTGEVRRVRSGVVYVLLDEAIKRGKHTHRRLAAYLPNQIEAVSEA